MIKDFAWQAFKNTGNIDTFLELKMLEKIETNNLYDQKVEENGYSKNERNNNCRK